MKVGFIATVFNEEKTIDGFLQSLLAQTKTPDEIVIVDAASKDATFSKLKAFQSLYKKKHKKVRFQIGIKKGNRSVGRNEAIRKVDSDIIAVSDSGCLLDKNWLRNITNPFFKRKNVDVVAGYYKAKARSVFEKSVVPYALVMPDKVNPKNFLPATRSMAFTKKIWEKVGGFDKKFSHNEDFVFANKLKEKEARIVFEKSAIVFWIPRKNVKSLFIMFFRFAFGDSESGIFRTNVLLLFYRYILAAFLFALFVLSGKVLYLQILCVSLLGYLVYSVYKNYRYVGNVNATYILPIIQFTADGAVLLGSILGGIKKIRMMHVGNLIAKNWLIASLIALYTLALLSVVTWGLPNPSHPFPYHMDEWHQLAAVRSMFSTGTSNVEGAAHGPVLEFFIVGLYLIPFYILKVIDPFAIVSSVTSLDIQEKLFVILRLNTLLYGVGTMLIMARIARKYFLRSEVVAVTLFTVTPIWLSLSNYFKYDIALLFWIVLSLLFVFEFKTTQKQVYYYMASIVCAVALAVKISVLPLPLVIVLSYVLFSKNRSIRTLIAGIVLQILTFVCFGIPDILYRSKEYIEYLYSNTIGVPFPSKMYILKHPSLMYVFLRQMPTSFGFVTYSLFVASFFYLLVSVLTGIFKRKVNSMRFFILVSIFIFAISLIPLKFDAGGNRVLVLLPFGIISIVLFFEYLKKHVKKTTLRILMMVFCIIFCVQIVQSFMWIQMRSVPSVQYTASMWIKSNIPKGSAIGIETIPIYQLLPEFIVNDYYQKIYDNNYRQYYTYTTLERGVKLPSTIVLTNDLVEENYFRSSQKKMLINRLKKENYHIVTRLTPAVSVFKFFGNEFDFFLSGLMASPTSITIYKR